MKTLQADFKIVTSMFIQGGQKDADLRPPSIKGALRFWWRAIHWGQCLAETSNEKEALKQLYRQEAELFGAAVKDERYGQGLFSLKLSNNRNIKTQQSWPKLKPSTGAGYIGYGLDKDNNNPHRISLEPTQFSLTLVLKTTITETQIQQLKTTLKAWGFLGGLGSRARRGFGSVALTALDDQNYQFNTHEDYFQAIKELISHQTLAPAMPIFTAFNQDMKISSPAKQNRDYRKIMNEMGDCYKDQREKAVKTADRAVYGLPLKEVDEKNRRSSPLLFHVHELATGHIGIFTFIPANFHFDKRYEPDKMKGLFTKVTTFMDEMEAIYP